MGERLTYRDGSIAAVDPSQIEQRRAAALAEVQRLVALHAITEAEIFGL